MFLCKIQHRYNDHTTGVLLLHSTFKWEHRGLFHSIDKLDFVKSSEPHALIFHRWSHYSNKTLSRHVFWLQLYGMAPDYLNSNISVVAFSLNIRNFTIALEIAQVHPQQYASSCTTSALLVRGRFSTSTRALNMHRRLANLKTPTHSHPITCYA